MIAPLHKSTPLYRNSFYIHTYIYIGIKRGTRSHAKTQLSDINLQRVAKLVAHVVYRRQEPISKASRVDLGR